MKRAVRSVSWFWRWRGYIVGGGAIICAVAVAVALPRLFAFEVNYWSWLAGDDSGSATISNVALVLAGAIALSLAVWRARVASRQADTAQQGLLDERYQKGAEMLGSQVNAVRLGGIYALERLARDYPGAIPPSDNATVLRLRAFSHQRADRLAAIGLSSGCARHS